MLVAGSLVVTSPHCEQQPADSMASQGKMKLRLHCRGQFVKNGDGSWKYEGGEVFNDSCPMTFKYADLCHKLNDKFGETVSIRYLTPGEALDPNNLVAVADDGDLAELLEEYQTALQRPGTPLKTFRIHMYVERALQFETAFYPDEEAVDAEEEAEHDIMDASLCDNHDDFNPDSWCSDDHSMASANPSTDTEAPFMRGFAAPHAAMGHWGEALPPVISGSQHYLQQQSGLQGPLTVQVPDLADCLPDNLDDTTGLITLRGPVAAGELPAAVAASALSSSGAAAAAAGLTLRSSSGVGGRSSGGGALHPLGLPTANTGRALEHHALHNINKSVSKCELSIAGRRSVDGYGAATSAGYQYEDLDDPYHETDEPNGSAGVLHQGQYPDTAVNMPAHGKDEEGRFSPWAWNNDGLLAGFMQEGLSQHHHHKPPHGPPVAHHGDLVVGTGLPSHISEFGDGCSEKDDADGAGAGKVQLPSHISAFGDGSFASGERPRMATQDRELLQNGRSGAGLAARRALGLPTALDDSAQDARRSRTSKVITQEFANDDDSLVRPLDGPLDFHNLDGDATVEVAPTPKTMQGPLIVKVAKDDVRISQKIGEGAFGEVSKAQVFPYGNVAIKWLKRDRFAKYSESFQREAEVLAKLNHPNIIRMFGLVMEGDPNGSADPVIAGIMTEYVRNGSLSQKLRTMRQVWGLKERCQVALQAALGMAYLHDQDPAVIHFDLKPDNLLVDGEGDNMVIKVADFGLSKHKFQSYVTCRDLRGTLPYMAPELVSNPNQVCEKCDVWSMGVVMWEMCTLEVPFQELSAQQILMGLMHGNLHLPVPEDCEPEWQGLIEACMEPNPSNRPTFKQLATQLETALRQAMASP